MYFKQNQIFLNTIRRHIYAFTCHAYCSTSNLSNEIQNAKPFSEMPKLSFFKVITRNLPSGKYYRKTLKENLDQLSTEYGNIVRIPPMFKKPEMVITYNPDDFEKVFRAEGSYPVRYGLETLNYYRINKRPEIYEEYGSLLISIGEKWWNLRSIANPIVLHPKTIKEYFTQIDEIAKEFVDILKNIRKENNEMPGNFSHYIEMLAMEAISAIGLERRFNCLNENIENETAIKLMEAIKFTIEESVKFDIKIPIWKYYQTKKFRDVLDSSDRITNIIMHYIDMSIEEINRNELISKNSEDSVLRKLLKIDKKVATVVVLDLIMAGIDSVAGATLFTLYCLAKNPEKQEILRQELLNILPEKNSPLTPEKTRNMPYLRAVIKETYRHFPVIQGTSRMTTKDVVLSGYHVPANVHVVMQPHRALHDEKYFPNPSKFLPERWLREQSEGCPKPEASNPFIFLPFGHGRRSCVGKRIAELELEIILANLIRNFKFEWHHPDIKIRSAFINSPDSEMKFKVIDV